ncbi:FecR family protein [Pseudoduganella lurida]|uniref:FecR family protein n=1 Tax=Pseudoduganella lurida TaxID=1036180 RepID=A0A562RKB8_9BURK|nr:FecR domain-containing protein [Pseudoduganella lurida]TWI69489.1 FecR family protein [Pseudoduganella lurida]
MDDKNMERDKGALAVEAVAAAWLARCDRHAWNGEEQRRLDAWLAEDTLHRVAWLRLRGAWEGADAIVAGASHAEAAPAIPRRAAARHLPWRMAAGLVLACALGVMLALRSGGDDVQRYATQVGERRSVALADGSRLQLNTATRLRTVGDQPRHVWLDGGEAYFDIAHDPAHPFVIEAGSSRVTVLGTRFTVRRDGDSTRVLVEQGRVRLSEKTGAVELARNEEAVAQGGVIVRAARSPAQAAQRLAWRNGRIVFDGTTLAEAAAEFNRYNARRLVVDDPVVAGMAIGGSFAPTNVEGFARLLEQGFGLHARRHADRIEITR